MVQSILIILSVIAAIWLLLSLFLGSSDRLRATSQPAGQGQADAEAGSGVRYPAVSIRTFRNGCPAAEALKGKRFLAEEAPPLPLPDCKWSRCHCKYAHHADRRTGNIDRRRMIGDQREYPMSLGRDDPRAGRGRRRRDGELLHT